MLCTKCGANVPEGNAFCPNCGNPMTAPSAPTRFCGTCGATMDASATVCPNCGTPVPGAAPTYGAPTYGAPVRNAAGIVRTYQNPGQGLLFSIVSSTTFLVALIAFTVSVVFSLFSSISASTSLMDTIYNILPSDLIRELPREVRNIFEGVSNTMVLTSILTALPGILTGVCLWFFFMGAKDRQYEHLCPTGFNILRILYTVLLAINAVLYGLGLLFYLFILLGVLSQSADAFLILFFTFILLAGIAALVIFFYLKVIQAIKVGQDCFNGSISDNVSTFLAICLFALGGIGAIGALFSLSAGIVAFLTGAASATAYIAFGLIVFNYQTQAKAALLR